MRKPDKKETVNLFFSAFLILAFIVCAHFFTQFTANLDATLGAVINICVYAVFGLLVFYATRVGDGKPVKRFSPVTLIVMVLPSLYIIIASVAKFMPLNNIFAGNGGSTLWGGFGAYSDTLAGGGGRDEFLYFDGGGNDGQATLTVSSSGKISGKYLSGGQTWTLAAASAFLIAVAVALVCFAVNKFCRREK